MKTDKTDNYVPFGEEWKAEVRKLKKEMIIELYANACQKPDGWNLSREKMPDYDGWYYVYGFMHESCGAVNPFHKIVRCHMSQWVKSDTGEQMTFWRPLLTPPQIESTDEF